MVYLYLDMQGNQRDEEDDYIPTWKESQDRLGLLQKASHIICTLYDYIYVNIRTT